MDATEVYRRFKNAQKRFYQELSTIQREFISSNFKFKEGDVVWFKNYHYKAPTLIVIDSIYFHNTGDYAEERFYQRPVIKISGHMVDEEGYDITYFKDSDQAVSVDLNPEEITQITTIKPKGLKRRL